MSQELNGVQGKCGSKRASRVVLLAGALGVLGLAIGNAQGQDQPTMKSLLADGFEVKSTMLVPQDVATRVHGQKSLDSTVFTLQKGPRLAFCYFTMASVFEEGQFLDEACFYAQ